jgi:hypothetical protein
MSPSATPATQTHHSLDNGYLKLTRKTKAIFI